MGDEPVYAHGEPAARRAENPAAERTAAQRRGPAAPSAVTGTAAAARPFVLFVPSYGKGGTGEFVRAVTLAQAVQRRWPQARIEFLLPGGAGTRQDAPFPSVCHAGPEQDKGAFDREHIARLRPHVVVFDSGCRSATLRLCRRLGIRTAYVSSRAGTCRKPFRLDWLRTLDQHWHMREHLTGEAFTARQRWLARFSNTRRLQFDTFFPDIPADWNVLPAAVRERLGGRFVLLSPGGGGYRIDGALATDLFLDAAEMLYADKGVACLTLLGPLYPGQAAAARRTASLAEVPQALFLELMRRASVVVTNGGGSLNQALACRAACVAAPLGAADQPARIAACANAGLVVSVPPQAQALAAAAARLLDDEAARAALRGRVEAVRVVNGIPLMVEAVGELLRQAGAA